MKIAVLLTGNIRTWNRSNLFDFIDQDVDYYISTTNKKYNYHPFISNKLCYNDINNEIVSDKQIKELFDDLNCVKLLINDDDIINNNDFEINMRNIDSCYHQFNRIKKVLYSVEKHEDENNFKYDIIVKTRFDLKYFGKLNSYLDIQQNNIIHTSTGNGNPNDTILISKRNVFFNIINYMMDEFYNQNDIESHLNPPHGLLMSSFKNNNLIYKREKIAEIIRL